MYKAEAILKLRPSAIFNIIGDKIEWLDTEQSQPSEEEIKVEMDKLTIHYNSLEYARLRKEEYEKLNQDELRFDDLVNGTTVWVDTINAIKAKYPKG